MSDSIPRLRMFAGPNGSGKTTVKQNLHKPDSWFGIYINPDDLEDEIFRTGALSLKPFGLTPTTLEIQQFFSGSTLLRAHDLRSQISSITCRGQDIDFSRCEFNSYHASVLADFLRRQALARHQSFTFETVMSAPDKILLLHQAQNLGFRTYLYYIATEDPEINIQRVANRVLDGGHDVPREKIIARYDRSLALLPKAIPLTNRAYFFDTSEEDPWYFAEATDGTKLELKSDEMPRWFEPVWDHFGS